MQKNNQPCLIFQKFGYCSGHQKGACVKRHDKKQISLCKKWDTILFLCISKIWILFV